jgi:hypothetical protein
MCQIPRAVTIQAQELFNWQNGQLIQNAMPNLDSTDREFLISGICGKCFDKMFEDK